MNQFQFSKNLLSTIKSLNNNQLLNSWIYKGKTNIAYGSPNGGWDDVDGYLFEKEDKSYSYIIRSIPSQKGSCYIVIESINIHGQLYNMDLNNPRTFTEHLGKTSLLESYRMTAGKGKKKEIDVKNAFKSIGISTNEISILDDIQPDWIKTITDILEWGILREKVKLLLKNKVESTSNGITKHDENKMTNQPLNQILYGPPGTGKTYNTINKAISIINPSFDLTQERTAIKKEYNRLVTENQILFTTFHQSMSYEDFIEGIKPETKEENVIYDVVPGLFLEICNSAENNWEDAKEGNSKKLSFEDAFLLLKEEWVEKEEIRFPLKREGNDYTILGFTKKSIQFKKASGGTGHTLSIATLKDYYYKKKEVRMTGVGIYYPSILDKLNKYQPTIISKKVVKNYVIIIDEINRGNVSQIFGELITLIEEQKRLGKDEALVVTLPYSKEKFGVPPNLYIIGTMNTADRSVEALDTALRRRFSFEEMPPLYDLIELESQVYGYALKDILATLNKRIVRLLNNDHAIGHSYFLNKDEDTIIESFNRNIIPLLQEYFFGDYGKMMLVLGDGFVNYDEWKDEEKFFASYTDAKNDYDVKDLYSIQDYSNNKQGFAEALKKLMNQ